MYSHFHLKHENDYSFRPNLVWSKSQWEQCDGTSLRLPPLLLPHPFHGRRSIIGVTCWPPAPGETNQIQYFIPLTDAEFQERLERHKGEIAIMLKSSEFNQDKTTLIVTNNPLPLLISGQQLATRFQFFSKDLLGTSMSGRRASRLPPLKMTQKQLMSLDWETGKPMPFRFATEKDFKAEAQFSKGYAERRLQKMYPHLGTHTDLAAKREPLPRIEGWSPQISHWEPLTLSCLTEIRPTLTAPGDDGFRYGKAPLWVINSSVVPGNAK